jgi:predicted RND superfamily exporter protein
MKLEKTQRVMERIIDARWLLAAIAVVAALLAWRPAQQVKYDRSLQNMFSARDPVVVSFKHYKEIFGNYEVVLAVYEDPQLLVGDGSGLARVAEVSKRLRAVPGVRDVLSLAEINRLVEGVQPTLSLPLLAPKREQPALLDPTNRLAQSYLELFTGYTHSVDGKVASLACMIDPAAVDDPDPQRKIVDGIREVMAHLPDGLAPGVVAGEPVMIVDGFRLVERDGQSLALWSTVLLSITLALCFRSWRWLVAPLAVVQLTTLSTKALLAVSGLSFTLVSSMLSALVTVVGVATITHLIVGFYEGRQRGKAARTALTTSGTLLAWPIVGAIVTDAIGFGSLWWSDVRPVFDFGTMMVVGSLLVLPAIALVIPALALVGQTETETTVDPPPDRVARALEHSVRVVAAYPVAVTIAAIVLTLVAIAGSLRLTVETDFTKNFRPESELVRSYDLIESKLGGAGVWDVLIPAPAILDQAYLDHVQKVEAKLREIRAGQGGAPALTKVLSLADAIQAAQADPKLGALPPEFRAQGMAAVMPNFTAALRAKDAEGQWWLRIMLRSPERLPADVKEQTIAAVEREVAAAFPATADQPAGEVTGYHVLVTRLVHSLVRDQWIMFGLSCAGIFLVVLFAFRSPVLAALSLVPNALPVLMVTGLMGWVGVHINMGAAMIAAVSMGLSVDSSIHYIAAFRRAQAGGKTVAEALHEVQQSVGRAMLLSTLAIVVGFGVLCRSEFIPTVYFGALAALTMLGGLVGNLIILPLMLRWVSRDDKSVASA